MKTKHIALMLAFTIISSLFNAVPMVSYAQQQDTEDAYLEFGEKMVSSKMSSMTNCSINTYGGSEAAVIDPLHGQTELLLKLGGEFSNISDGNSVKVYVTYYDKGNGKCAFFYDGINGTTEHPERIYTKDTGVYKTKVFDIQNPKFNGGINGGDIRLALTTSAMGTSNSALIVSNIRVEKQNTKSVYSAKMTTGKVANAYFSDEELAFDVTVTGISSIPKESEQCDITYSIVDEFGNTMWSMTEEDVKLSHSAQVKPENIKFGIHEFRVTVENKEYNYRSEYSWEFSYIVDAPRNEDYGLATHYGSSWDTWGIEDAMYLFDRSGTGFLRDGIIWNQLETAQGSYTVPASCQKTIDEKNKYGLKTLAVDSFGNPAWQPGIPQPYTYMPETDEAIEAFANYTKKTTELGMEYHEVWNEPNTGFNAGNTGWDIYGKIVMECAKKIKAANPNAQVVPGSIVSIPDVPYNQLEAIFATGAGDYMDAFCIHPYIWDASPSQTGFHGKLAKLRKWLDDKGYPNIDVWVTEMGWGAGPCQAFTFEEQAAYLAQSYIIFKAVNPGGKFVWYDAIQDGLSETNREHNFGIINSWGAAKRLYPRKAYVALANMNNLMVGSEFVNYEDKDNKGFSYHFKTRDNEDMYAVFSTDKSYMMGFATGEESVKVIDLYGNESTIYAVDGVVNILAGESAKYIITKGELKITEPTVYPEIEQMNLIYGEEQDIKITAPGGAAAECRAVGEDLDLTMSDELDAKLSIATVKNDDDDVIKVKVKDGDKLLLDGDISVKYKDAVDVSILNTPYNDKNYNRWVGTLVITNNSSQNSITGKMIFDAPDFFAKKLPAVEISEVLPGETKRIKFHLPEILKKEVYDLNGRIILDSGYVKTFADRIDFAVAKYAENITIDGVMEDGEWSMGTALTFDDPDKYFAYAGYKFNGTDDLSGKAVVAYDEENIYLGVQVTDDVFYCQETTNGIWADDSIQCAMAYARLNGDPDSTARTEFGMALTPEGEKIFNYSVEDISIATGEIDIKKAGGDLAIKREGNVTTYELKIPLTQLFQRNAKVGSGYRVAFSLLINDNDGKGRKGGAEIASGIIGNKSIDLFTFLQFMEK